MISQDSIIRDVRDAHPGITAVFEAHGLPCAGCQVGSYETIAQGARTHQLDVTPLLADLERFSEDGTIPAPREPTPGAAPRSGRPAEERIAGIKNIIAIVSGKGGVGKSLVTGLLAVTLRRQGYAVGILDGDITGPSIPHMFGVPPHSLDTEGDEKEKPRPPRSSSDIPIMSMNVLLDDVEAAVVWRGPMISTAIRQFYTDMEWGELDYLLIDLPPGTSDAPMTALQGLSTDGVIVVGTPQGLATMVVSKAIGMVKKFDVPILGLVENMSYITLPDGSDYELFGPSQGQRLVGLSGAPLLGRLPIDPLIAELCDAGRIEDYNSGAFDALAANVLTVLASARAATAGLPRMSSRDRAGARSLRAVSASTAADSQEALPPRDPEKSPARSLLTRFLK